MIVYLWASLLVLVNVVWLATTLLTLPGNWLMVGTTALVAWWQWDAGMFHPVTLLAVVLLAVVGEVLEFFASAAGVRRAGGSRWGALGSVLGALGGAIAGTVLLPVPLVGSLVGACLGACAGAWVFELSIGRGQGPSIKAGVGAGGGRLLATGVKLALGAIIWTIVAVGAFWP